MLKLRINFSGGIDEIVDVPLLVNLPRSNAASVWKVHCEGFCGLWDEDASHCWCLGSGKMVSFLSHTCCGFTTHASISAWSYGIIQPGLSTGSISVSVYSTRMAF